MDKDFTPETSRTATKPSSVGGPLAELKGHVNRHPYETVAAALGIGYVLGGGLFTPLTSRLVRLGLGIGIRTALLPILKAELSELAAAFIGDKSEQEEAT
jgi:hypothetical protein